MRTKERILTIRLLEKIKENPAYAELIGIEVMQEPFGTGLNVSNEGFARIKEGKLRCLNC